MAGTLIVSLDFELFWGMTDCCTLNEYREHLLGARKAIPRLLELFETYDIHATWATVGFLFAEDRDEIAAVMPQRADLPRYPIPEQNTYRLLETIGRNEREAPCFYAPSLIRRIADTAHQEIASHTFSHFYCREEGQTPEQFRADMSAAKAIAEKHGYTLSTVVLPRNQCEEPYTKVLGNLGFKAYRDEENDWIHENIRWRPLMRLLRLADVYVPLTGQGGYHPKKEHGVWNLVGSRMYKPIVRPLRFLEGLKIRRIKQQMLHAAKNGLTFHLWWHPHNIGVMMEDHLAQLSDIFEYYVELREAYQMQSLNMREAVAQLDDQE